MVATAGILTGVRVLDLADVSGAYCGKLLADMGADVILIEPPGGAPMRTIGPFHESPDPNRSLFFWHYGTNKRSVTLDLSTAAGREQFLQLAVSADLVVETTRPGQLESQGLGFDRLAAANPGLTLISITPFGQTGPYRDWNGSDLVAQALGGMVAVNGHADDVPLQGAGLQAYHSASTYAAIGALLALFARASSGLGQWVDVSIQACVAASLEHASSFFHQDGTVATRHGSLHWSRAFRIGRCTDGYVLHCTLGDWTSLIEWVNSDGKAADLLEPPWDDFFFRRANCEHLFDVLDAWAAGYAVQELVEAAQLRRLPYAAVVPPAAVPENSQLRQRRFFVPVPHDELGTTITYPGAPYVFGATPWTIRRRPPLLGEHTREVLDARVAGNPTPAPTPARAERRETTRAGALSGVRVLDFTWVVAGPVATRILADHGAEVIKIERRDALDYGSRRGGLTGNLNRGKRSLVLNMNEPRAHEIVQQLVARADVVIDNFSARVMRNWGLDYEGLRRLKPDIIAVSMSGFGHTGPQRDYVSYGPTLQALCGYPWLMRRAGGQPAGWGFSYSDMAGGYSGALAVLLALWHRRRTGVGQHIDLSQFENVAALLGPSLLQVLQANVPGVPSVEPVGNRSQEAADGPHGVYRCADDPSAARPPDRWCAIAVLLQSHWERLCAALEHPAWTREPRFATALGRVANATALDEHVEAWTRTRRAEAVMRTLQGAGVPAGIVATADDLCHRDPQLQARGYWVRLATPEGGEVTCDGVPLQLSATPGHVAGPGPLLGEHTDSILRDLLGFPPDTVAALRDAGVIN